MKRSLTGFTIIELIIALAVAVVLTGVGVSRYGTFARTQEFVSGAQKIVDCLQRGQQLSLTNASPQSGKLPFRYVVVNIADEADASGVVCKVESFDAATNLTAVNALPGTGSAQYSAKAADIKVTPSSAPIYRVIFGVTERGLPLDYTNNGSVSSVPSGATQGFSSQFSLRSQTGSESATITIGQLGSPITLEVN